MSSEADPWYDDTAGPVVRPYALTRGRTSHAAEDHLDLNAVVVADEYSGDVGGRDHTLVPEHLAILERALAKQTSVAELVVELDLPVAVVRVLTGDLLDAELIHITRPVPAAELPEESILREVISGLRGL
jgi:hypothetical protein